MKKGPYHEIINLREEQKEYGRLCRGKSKKYKFYTDWETHIRGCLSSFKNPQDLYNFKRYCINIDRNSQKAPEMFMNYALLLVPLYINAFFENLHPSFELFAAIVIIVYIMIQNIKLNQESGLARDIIEIIEKIEKERDKVNPI